MSKPDKPDWQRTVQTAEQELAPGSVIGILGSGQLGRMSAIEARHMGYRIVTLSPKANSPCGQVADREIVGSLDDVDAALELADAVDVVTYEFENVDAALARAVSDRKPLYPGVNVLEAAQHRLKEKRALNQAGVATADFRSVASFDDLERAANQLGVPCVLKTTTGGYDGKGQVLIEDLQQLSDAYEELSAAASQLKAPVDETMAPFILEGFVSFEKELSVIAARSASGSVVTFPVGENIHRDGILHVTIAPARVTQAVQHQAAEVARKVVDGLDVVGVIGIEMFLLESDGANRLLVNEIAPRPHNSGHYTLDACSVSQFEQHVRSVCGLPLAEPNLQSAVVMVNILGQHLDPLRQNIDRLLAEPAVKLHLYDKDEARFNRKMGHLCVLAEDAEKALGKAATVWELFADDRPFLPVS